MSEKYHVTGRQIAAARTLLSIEQTALAKKANVSIATLRRMEANEGEASGYANNVLAVVRALEADGIEFIPENGGGAGVRLRKRGATGSIPVEKLNASNDE